MGKQRDKPGTTFQIVYLHITLKYANDNNVTWCQLRRVSCFLGPVFDSVEFS